MTTFRERLHRAEPGERPQLVEIASVLDRLEEHGDVKLQLVDPEGETTELPASVCEALRSVVNAMAKGQTLAMAPLGQELTTQQAADLLHISRPSLVKLLEDGRIGFHKVGTHRRMKIEDVLRYRAERAAKRGTSLQELTALSEELGYR